MISLPLAVEGFQNFGMNKPEMPKPGDKTLRRICCLVIPVMKRIKSCFHLTTGEDFCLE